MDFIKIKNALSVALMTLCLAFPLCADSATVVSAEGKVEVERGGKWVPLAVNDTVSEGEMISTGFKSKAALRCKGSLLTLGALTRITLEKLVESEKSDTVAVYLNTGAVKSTVKSLENRRVNYTVRNPVAVASVRGTEFDFSGDGSITCTEGAVVTYGSRSYNAATAVEAPAEGKSNAATPATDIAPTAPSGAVVVLQGQAVSFSSDGMTSTPAKSAFATASQVGATMRTPAEIESVGTGVSDGSNTQVPKIVGTVRLNLSFDD